MAGPVTSSSPCPSARPRPGHHTPHPHALDKPLGPLHLNRRHEGPVGPGRAGTRDPLEGLQAAAPRVANPFARGVARPEGTKTKAGGKAGDAPARPASRGLTYE